MYENLQIEIEITEFCLRWEARPSGGKGRDLKKRQPVEKKKEVAIRTRFAKGSRGRYVRIFLQQSASSMALGNVALSSAFHHVQIPGGVDWINNIFFLLLVKMVKSRDAPGAARFRRFEGAFAVGRVPRETTTSSARANQALLGLRSKRQYRSTLPRLWSQSGKTASSK